LSPNDPALSPGPIKNSSGDIVGEHSGYARFTIGQRRRLPGGSLEPLYVSAIVPEERAVVVGNAAELLGHRVTLKELNWLSEPLETGSTCDVQMRYRASPVRARVARYQPADGGELVLDLLTAFRAITPGQSGVLYEGTRLLGGGVIN
ncbi:MAG: hypothetical protein PVH40_08680, partial [Gemmatimonadales bacterium]